MEWIVYTMKLIDLSYILLLEEDGITILMAWFIMTANTTSTINTIHMKEIGKTCIGAMQSAEI